MRERLEELMKLLNLNPTQFANAIGVQRATLQHILSGRNEPSLKIIMAIHTSFPDVELEWLLNGKGSAIPQLQQNEPPQDDYPLLPGMETMFFPDDVRKTPGNSNLKGEESIPKSSKRRPRRNSEAVLDAVNSSEGKRIKEVVVFFSDGTYQKFLSDLKN